MSTRIAVKKLTSSDLTLFKEIFDSGISASKQKSINLNANPFTKVFYPNLDELADEYDRRFGVDLKIVGPDYSLPIHVLQRKIVKSLSGKNWRLNGELIPHFEDTSRYSTLEEGDIAIIEFSGTNKPERLKLLLISQLYDPLSHQYFSRIFQDLPTRNTMVDIDSSIISNWDGSSVFHLAKSFIYNTDFISESLLSGELENTHIDTEYSTRFLSLADLNSGKIAAEKTGAAGEGMINYYLTKKYDTILVEWISMANPIAPFDFKLSLDRVVYLDVKSTKGKFGQAFYMSLNELKAAASVENYRIYRVYDLNKSRAYLKISNNIKDLAISILESLSLLIDGVKPTALSINPAIIDWADEINIVIEEEE